MAVLPDLNIILNDWSVAFFRRSMQEFMRAVRAEGLSLPQLNVLMRLYHGGPCEIAGLLGTLQASKAGAGQLVERMEQDGLVQRLVSPTDRRARRVELTERGLRVVENSLAAHRRWVEDLLAAIPAEEQSAVAQSLQTLTRIALSLEQVHRAASCQEGQAGIEKRDGHHFFMRCE